MVSAFDYFSLFSNAFTHSCVSLSGNSSEFRIKIAGIDMFLPLGRFVTSWYKQSLGNEAGQVMGDFLRVVRAWTMLKAWRANSTNTSRSKNGKNEL